MENRVRFSYAWGPQTTAVASLRGIRWSEEELFMALKVIGAGLGRTATFSLKFALEHIGLGPCYHMAEVFAGARRNVPLWLDVVRGKPDWDAIFEGYQSTTDYPACSYWRELAGYYPEAKVILSVRMRKVGSNRSARPSSLRNAGTTEGLADRRDDAGSRFRRIR